MLTHVFKTLLYGAVFLSIVFIDYFLGNGLVDVSRKVYFKVARFIEKSIREEAKMVQMVTETPISLPMLIAEIIALLLTVAFLKKYKSFRYRDHVDDLLDESKESLRQTNEFLEKWRLRRIHWQEPTGYTYLDDEPQDIKPLKLEVPILHMAIIDTLGKTRLGQPESGDAGDTIDIANSALLSLTSLLSDDLESTESIPKDRQDQNRNVGHTNRSLWDVIEEDGIVEED